MTRRSGFLVLLAVAIALAVAMRSRSRADAPQHVVPPSKSGDMVVGLCDGVTTAEIPGVKEGQMPTKAQAQDVAQPDFYARLGVARIKLADDGPIFLNGVQDPNADYETPEDWILSGELGWFVHPRFALQVSATTPATTSNIPAGSLAGLPNLGDDSFSIFTLTGNFHPLRGGPVSPYVGAGLAWHHTWDTDDGLAANLRIGDAVGPVVQAGVEVPLGGVEQLLVVLDHALEKQLLRLRTGGVAQCIHLVVVEHAIVAHALHVAHPVHALAHRIAPVIEPTLHQVDLGLLGLLDPGRQVAHLR